MATIMRCHRDYDGPSWVLYDRAFPHRAEATKGEYFTFQCFGGGGGGEGTHLPIVRASVIRIKAACSRCMPTAGVSVLSHFSTQQHVRGRCFCLTLLQRLNICPLFSPSHQPKCTPRKRFAALFNTPWIQEK